MPGLNNRRTQVAGWANSILLAALPSLERLGMRGLFVAVVVVMLVVLGAFYIWG